MGRVPRYSDEHFAAACGGGGGGAGEAAGQRRTVTVTSRRRLDRRLRRPRKMRCIAAGADGERLVELAAPLTEDVEPHAAEGAGRGGAEGAAPLHRARDGDGDPRAVSRDQAGPRPRDRQRLLLRRYRETPFTEADLAAIEARMAEVVARDENFVRVEEPRDAGLEGVRRARRLYEGVLHREVHPAGRRDLALQERRLHRFLPRPALPSTGRVKAFKSRHRRRLLARRREEPAAAAHLRHRVLSTRRTSTPTSSTSKRSRRATTACSASSSTSSPSRRSPARASSSGTPRAA